MEVLHLTPTERGELQSYLRKRNRECLNHFIILNARHLKRTLAAYFRYYHQSRPHLALEKQCPIERQIMKHSAIAEIPELGGARHRHERFAA